MLEIKNFSKFYGDKKVVDNLSISVQSGDIYGFIGANGAGKTTLFNMQDKDLGVRVNSDEIVVANGGDWRNSSDQARAMKEAVKLIKKCINNQCDFNQETTLTGKSIINNIIKAGEKGFKIKMN